MKPTDIVFKKGGLEIASFVTATFEHHASEAVKKAYSEGKAVAYEDGEWVVMPDHIEET